ncbi:hypothetical protein [uncultured Alistipes sp.]|uniref:hypothetical protein n=1 Tax=uncultured Alistipes sp. TaxID=538949 RepID=UPI0025924E32|nr:hypothetical protein [uncultured Alistipes sp.]
MKKTVLNYLGVAARLPFAVAGGLLLLAGAVFNTLASLCLCNVEDAKDYLSTIK